jgi:hypothetical protein
MPHTLRSIELADEQITGLAMLAGSMTTARADHRHLQSAADPYPPRARAGPGQAPGPPGRLRPDPDLADPGRPQGAGARRIPTRLTKRVPRMGKRLAEEIAAALAEQTVVVAGTSAAGIVLPRLAAQLAKLRAQREDVAAKSEELVRDHPLHQVLMSIPVNGIRTTAGSWPNSPARTSPPRHTWPPTPAWPPSPAAPAHLDPRRPPQPGRQLGPQMRALPRRLHLSQRPHLPALLQPQTSRGQETQPGSHRPRPPTRRRPLRHAPRRLPLRPAPTPCRLTKI